MEHDDRRQRLFRLRAACAGRLQHSRLRGSGQCRAGQPHRPAMSQHELDPMVARAVESLGILCEVLPCNPEWADTEAFCAHYNIPRDRAANTILVAAKTEPKQYAACLV